MDEKDAVGAVEIGGRTRLCGLIGNPVEHTLSPMIHNTLAAACGCDMAYLPFLVEKEGAVRVQRGVCVKRAGFKRHRSVQDGGNSLSGERRQTGSGCGIC